jgi:hypothetical protein
MHKRQQPEQASRRRPASTPTPFTYDTLFSSYLLEWKKRSNNPHLQVTTLCLKDEEGYLLVGSDLGSIFVFQKDDKKDDTSWEFRYTIPISKQPISFLHYDTAGNGIFAGSTEGLYHWPKVDKICGDESTLQAKVLNVDILHAQANDTHIYIITDDHQLCQLAISDMTIDIENPWTRLQIFENSSSSSERRITSLHLTSSNILLLGTNQSKVLCWNIATEKFSKPLLLPESDSDITSIISSNQDWWTVASSSSKKGNFMRTWHGPTRSEISKVQIREIIQGLGVSTATNQLYSIGNESFLTVWDSPYQLERVHRIRMSAHSNQTLSIDNMLMVVAGAGTTIDLVEKNVCLLSMDIPLENPEKSE